MPMIGEAEDAPNLPPRGGDVRQDRGGAKDRYVSANRIG